LNRSSNLAAPNIRAVTSWACLALPVACAAPPEASGNSCGRPEALVSGVANAAYLGLSESEENAVVDLTFSLSGGEERCSGTLIADGWVLTASHCARGEAEPAVTVRLGRHSLNPVLTAQSTATWSHPSLDLLLIQADLSGSSTVSPIAPGAQSVPAWGDDRVQLAGYGLDEDLERGERAFLVERIVEVGVSTFVVDGLGNSGACAGDSGGPALGRGADGRAIVLGVLSAGSATCRGRDSFVRLDAALDWVAEHVGASAPAAPPDCGAIDSKGKCFGDRAMWCSGSSLSVEACGGSACGWDAGRGGFGCVARSADPCEGVPGDGTCAGAVATYCRDGTLKRFDCSVCGGGCILSPASGGAACVRAAPDGPS
jgi:hypothetical protein